MYRVSRPGLILFCIQEMGHLEMPIMTEANSQRVQRRRGPSSGNLVTVKKKYMLLPDWSCKSFLHV